MLQERQDACIWGVGEYFLNLVDLQPEQCRIVGIARCCRDACSFSLFSWGCDGSRPLLSWRSSRRCSRIGGFIWSSQLLLLNLTFSATRSRHLLGDSTCLVVSAQQINEKGTKIFRELSGGDLSHFQTRVKKCQVMTRFYSS